MQMTELFNRSRIFLAALVALTICFPASGKIYRWVDENGQTHFSDSPFYGAEEDPEEQEYQPESSSLNFTDERTSPAGASQSKVTGRTAPEQQTSGSISIPYWAKEGTANRVIIDITFNDSVTVPIMVDTGSPGLVLSNDLANRLGLFDEAGGQLMVIISGIGGQQAAVRTIIEKISIGGISEEFIPAHIVPEMADAYQGLIGMDILAGYRMTIDSARQRLLAEPLPKLENLPGGRDRSWWQATFREFSYYNNFWDEQVEMINWSNSPYSRLPSSQHQRLKKFIEQQQTRAQALYRQLDRYARWQSVPRHWRR